MQINIKFQTLFFAVFFPVLLVAQSSFKEPLRVKRSEFKIADEGFRDAWIALRDAEHLYTTGPGAYRAARSLYLEANFYNSSNPELNYMIGRCYLFTDNKYESIKYIQKAYELKPTVASDIHLLLGMAYQQVHDFDNAIEEYNLFLKNLSRKKLPIYQERVSMYIRQCKNGRDLITDPVRVVINNLGDSINSEFDDYTAVVPADTNIMYFTSRRPSSVKSQRSKLDDKFYEDIYSSEYKDETWTTATRMNKKLVGKKNSTNIAIVGISPGRNILYIYRGKENSGDLFSVQLKKNGKWGSPKPFKKYNTKNRETSLCLSSDSTRIYFIAENSKTSFGGTDIFYAMRKENGKWGKPKNIGNIINTQWDEAGVSLSANDSTLYFSSQGHNSMGGYDIFKTELSQNGTWSVPVNLGYPINTPNDDVFYWEAPDRKNAWYASNRESGKGGLDIYKVIYLGARKEMVMSELAEPIMGILPPYDNIYFENPIMLTVDGRLAMRGKVTDSENGKPVKAKISFFDRITGLITNTVESDTSGNFSLLVPELKKYSVDISAEGYLMFLEDLDFSAVSSDEIFEKNYTLDRVEVGAKVILQNIYFETGKSELLASSYLTLNSVVRLLQTNPTLRLEISGHTDNVGSMKSNLKLSNDRAKACVDYLVAQGISAQRLEYKGYAFQFSIFPNTTEEGRAKNRRVEFKILSK